MNEKFETFDEEYRWHLFNQLDKRSKTFMTLFRVTMIFAFAFLAFILIPLVGLQHEEYKYNITVKKLATKKKDLAKLQQEGSAIEKQLNSLPDLLKELKVEADEKEGDMESINRKLEEIQLQVDKNTSQSGKLEEDISDMANIQDSFRRLPKYDTKRNVEKLRDSLLKLERYFHSPSEQPTDDPCVSANMNVFVRCKVKQIIREGLKKYQTVIRDADHVLSGYVELSGEKQIDERIEQVLVSLDQLMEENPQFWRTIRGKIFFFDKFEAPMQEVFQEVDLQISRYVKTLDSQKQKIFSNRQRLKEEGDSLEKELNAKQKLQRGIYDEIRLLDKKINKLKAEKSQLNTNLITTKNTIATLNTEIEQMQGYIDKIAKAKEDIAKRLEKIQSPFGSLPVGLNEAVLAFPVALAVAIVLFALVLADIIRLRKLYHQTTILCYPEDGQKIEDSISVLAPAWLDPIGDTSNPKRRILMLSLPALAYMIALLLIVYSWYIGEPQPGSTWLIRVGYLVLYALGVFGFMIGGLRIKQEWWDYRKFCRKGHEGVTH